MPRVTGWRLTRTEYAADAFSGEGARLYGGRWNPPGVAVVYLAQSRSLAVLEVLTQVRRMEDLQGYVLVPATFDAADELVLAPAELPQDWRALPAGAATRDLGARWARDHTALVLRVPSAVLPAESNWVLNPAHDAFDRVDIGAPEPLDVDPRLMRVALA